MGRHKRRPQKHVPTDSDLLKPAVFRKQKSRKRISDTRYPDSYLMNALVETLKKRLLMIVRENTEKGKNMVELKKDLLEKKRLPRDVIPEAEKEYDILPGTIENLLKNKLKSTANISHWTKVVNDDFDNIVADFKRSPSTQPSSSSSKFRSQPSTSKAKQSASTSQSSENIRTCTTSINSILKRTNVEQDVQDFFCKTLKETVESSSNYYSQFSILVYSIMMTLKRCCFVERKKDDVHLVPCETGMLSQFLPNNFQIEKDLPAPSPISSNAKLIDSDEKLKKDFETLFSHRHLQNIHSSYFGSRGINQATIDNYQLHSAILKLIPKDDDFLFSSDAAPAVMSSALV